MVRLRRLQRRAGVNRHEFLQEETYLVNMTMLQKLHTKMWKSTNFQNNDLTCSNCTQNNRKVGVDRLINRVDLVQNVIKSRLVWQLKNSRLTGRTV